MGGFLDGVTGFNGIAGVEYYALSLFRVKTKGHVTELVEASSGFSYNKDSIKQKMALAIA